MKKPIPLKYTPPHRYTYAHAVEPIGHYLPLIPRTYPKLFKCTIMCDHCRTYKPLLKGAETTTFYEQERPKIIDTPPRPPKPEDRSNGCCSWRQTCCGGGCCNTVRNCCSSGLKAQSPATEKQFNYGYNQPEMASYSMGMTAPAMPDRVPCSQQERKLPMCFGGDCAMSAECLSKTSSAATANSGNESTPRESER